MSEIKNEADAREFVTTFASLCGERYVELARNGCSAPLDSDQQYLEMYDRLAGALLIATMVIPKPTLGGIDIDRLRVPR